MITDRSCPTPKQTGRLYVEAFSGYLSDRLYSFILLSFKSHQHCKGHTFYIFLLLQHHTVTVLALTGEGRPCLTLFHLS